MDDISRLQVLLALHVDANGVARDAEVADAEMPKMVSPVFRAFAERARRAALDPRCATLPLPKTALGKPATVVFVFGL